MEESTRRLDNLVAWVIRCFRHWKYGTALFYLLSINFFKLNKRLYLPSTLPNQCWILLIIIMKTRHCDVSHPVGGEVDNYLLFRKWAHVPSPSWRRVKEEKRENLCVQSLLLLTLVLRIRQLWLNLLSAALYKLRNEGKLTIELCKLQWCETRIHLWIERIHTVTINLISPHNL